MGLLARGAPALARQRALSRRAPLPNSTDVWRLDDNKQMELPSKGLLTAPC